MSVLKSSHWPCQQTYRSGSDARIEDTTLLFYLGKPYTQPLSPTHSAWTWILGRLLQTCSTKQQLPIFLDAGTLGAWALAHTPRGRPWEHGLLPIFLGIGALGKWIIALTPRHWGSGGMGSCPYSQALCAICLKPHETYQIYIKPPK